jgi:hypothetical protein
MAPHHHRRWPSWQSNSQPRPRTEPARTERKGWLEGRRVFFGVALVVAFWIIVGTALAVAFI